MPIVHTETGEILDSTTTLRQATLEPDYVKLYVQAWCDFKAVKGVNVPFLVKLLPLMSFAEDDQRLILAPTVKREIASELGWSEKTALRRFNEELKKLVNAKVLKRMGTNVYSVNPELVGRGSWRSINQLRATFSVIGADAGTVSVETA